MDASVEHAFFFCARILTSNFFMKCRFTAGINILESSYGPIRVPSNTPAHKLMANCCWKRLPIYFGGIGQIANFVGIQHPFSSGICHCIQFCYRNIISLYIYFTHTCSIVPAQSSRRAKKWFYSLSTKWMVLLPPAYSLSDFLN